MGPIVVRRFLQTIPLLLLISVLAFALVQLLPGDPAVAIAGDQASRERVEEIREELGLDDPIVERYGRWLGRVLRGDLGESIITGRDLRSEIWRKLPITGSLAGGAILFALLLGVPVGVIQGTHPGGRVDRFFQLGTSLGLSIPNFWLGTILVTIFAAILPWMPAFGYVGITESPFEWARHLTLPVITLGVFAAAELARQVRAGLLAVQGENYIRTAWAKGLKPSRVVGRHALKNAAMPAVTILGVRMGRMLAGSVIVEAIFAMPGVGKMTIDAVFNRDFTAIQAVVLFAAVVVVMINLAVDLVYALLNPKVRVG